MLLPLSSSFKYVQFLIYPIIIILHMHSSHHSITLNAPKNNDHFCFIKSIFLFFISVARDSNVIFLCFNVVSKTTICIFFLVYYLFHTTYYMFLLYFIYILNMWFYFSHLTCTFHFNCCLNKIFVIVIVIVIHVQS